MGVSRQEDVDWGRKQSGLPFFDIILLDNLPKSAGNTVSRPNLTPFRFKAAFSLTTDHHTNH
jgi:hypothetical protein